MEYSSLRFFGIGLSRTGTTSLSTALNLIGFNVKHYPDDKTLYNEPYDAALDLPVAVNYKLLDSRFRKSKFIYTVRDKGSWLHSMEKYISGRGIESASQHHNRTQIYGRYDFNSDVYSAAYDRHHNDVMSYFKDRPDDLLVMDICGGCDGWDLLLPFVGKGSKALILPHNGLIFPNVHKQ